MNLDRTIVRALVLDAWYQVLDNRVFRILLLSCALLVALTFAIGFREDEIVLLFGWKRFTYEQIQDNFDLSLAAGIEQREGFIRLLQRLFVDQVAGNLGMTFAIAATAFFVPRLLEKGLADGLFSKPIARPVFYLSCYLTGLVFVGALALVLVVGMHFGLLLNSGYSDPGFLWGALTLTYTFALLHGVSMLIGVWTRSSVAALLLGLVFFLGNGCVHTGWMAKERLVATLQARGLASAGAESQPAEEAQADEEDGPPQAVVDGLFATLDVLHYVLPKTSEAEFLTEMVRSQLVRGTPDFADPETHLRIQRLPRGFALAESQAAAAPTLLSSVGKGARRLVEFELAQGRDACRIWIERANRPRGDRRMSDLLEAQLKQRPGAGNVEKHTEYPHSGQITFVSWSEAVDGEARARSIGLVRSGASILGFALDCAAEWQPPEPDPSDRLAQLEEHEPGSAEALQQARLALLRSLAGQSSIETEEDPLTGGQRNGPTALVAQRFGWTAPLKYNAFFSIGSSLAFTLAVLALGIWKLRRIDF